MERIILGAVSLVLICQLFLFSQISNLQKTVKQARDYAAEAVDYASSAESVAEDAQSAAEEARDYAAECSDY